VYWIVTVIGERIESKEEQQGILGRKHEQQLDSGNSGRFWSSGSESKVTDVYNRFGLSTLVANHQAHQLTTAHGQQLTN
jgi:hypothetical protein